MSSKPPPLAFAGTGPTQLRTGTSRWATRSASARPFCPSIPGVFSWSTTIAPARSASVEPLLEEREERSVDRPLDLDHAHRCGRRRGGGALRGAGERGAGQRGAREPAHHEHGHQEREACAWTHGGASYRPGGGAIRRILMGPNERGHRSPPGGTPATGGSLRPPPIALAPIRPRSGLLQADRRAPAHPGDPRHIDPHRRRARPSVRRRGARGERDPFPARRARIRLHADPPLPGTLDDLRCRRLDPHPDVPRQSGDRGARCHLARHPAGGPRDRGLGLLPARRVGRVVPDPGDRRERESGRGGPGRLDDHAAIGRPHPRAGAGPLRQEHRGQDPGARPGGPRRAAVQEGGDLRALPQPGLHGERRLRRRDGGEVLLPEARARAHPGRGSHARRLDP